MANGQGPISPDMAGQLMNSPLVQDDSVREQLGALAAPLINEPQETPIAVQEQVPESREEFIEGLTEVPVRIDPVIEEKAKEEASPTPETLSRADREQLVADKARQSMIDRINTGEVSEEDALKFLQADEQMQAAEEGKVEELDAAKVDGRQQMIQENYEKYLEKKSAVDQFNQLAGKMDGLVKKPEPNILEFLNEDDLSFAAQSGMDIPPAAAYKAEKELEQLELARETEDQAAAQRTLAAEQEASQRVASENQEKQQARVQQAANEVETEDKELEQEFTSLGELFDKGSLGRRIGTAIAILFGGLAQGMTGSNINPVMQVLDKEFARNDAKKQRALSLVKEQIKAQGNKLKDQEQLLKLRKLTNEIDLQERQLKAKRQLEKIVQQGGEVPESLLTTIGADKEARDRIVRGPEGKAYVADNKSVATNLTKAKDEAEPAIQGIDELLELSKNSNRLNLRDRARIYSRIRALVGKLRIPLTGPGVLTDTEYERLLNTLGDPNKIFAIKSIEEEKLMAVKDILKNDLSTRYRNAGINLPMSREEKIIDQTMRANPGKDKAAVIRALRRKGILQ